VAGGGGISGIKGLGAAGVVMGVRIHGSKEMIPDVSNRGIMGRRKRKGRAQKNREADKRGKID
jgi:hypothetical protein